MSVELFAAAIYGVWLGNFITTLYHRIPNEIPIGPKHKPFCSTCKKPIKFKQYLPLLYYIFSSRHCKHCNTKIPSVYFKMELLTAVCIILYYTFSGFGNDVFIAGSLLIPSCSLLFFVCLNYRFVHKDLIWIFSIACITYRFFALHDTIENVIVGLLFSYFTAKTIDGISTKARQMPIEIDAFRVITVLGLGIETAYIVIISVVVFIASFGIVKSKRIVYAFSKKSLCIVPCVVFLCMFLPSHIKYKVHIISKPFVDLEIIKHHHGKTIHKNNEHADIKYDEKVK